ncbi:MAG: BON domain-containing protein [Thermoguttaceae bacterium]|jgi:osmotically-inducible protein OsmY
MAKKGRCAMATVSVDDFRTRAQAALAGSPFYELRALRVERHHQALVISGTVSSFYQKQLAQEAVRSILGDVEIRNAIDVR